MILTPEVQAKIDSMDYMQILQSRRFSPIGSELWQGEVGAVMEIRFRQLVASTLQEERVSISKQIGW